jgi:hypothetical protein
MHTRTFHVADITAAGEVRATEQYQYMLLERIGGASDLIALFSSWLWRSPEAFEVILPGGRMRVRWRASAVTAGVASLWFSGGSAIGGSGQPGEPRAAGGELSSLAILLSGREVSADAITKAALQQHLVRELHDSGFEPGFGLGSLDQRPLVATLSLRPPTEAAERALFALWDRCFAASYFRKQGLV